MAMTAMGVLNWYCETYEALVFELTRLGVPFDLNLRVDRLVTPPFSSIGDVPWSIAYWNPQIRFNWNLDDQPRDVVVGCLHFYDQDAISGTIPRPDHPSIETYGFSFDAGDVTVFNTPKEAAEAIAKEYFELKNGGNNND